MTEPTPTTLKDFTPAWLTEELRRSQTIGVESSVTAVDSKILGEGEGFMGIVARLSLSYDGPAGPATLIAKIPTEVDENRLTGKTIGIYEREIRVYADILPTLDIPKPHVYTVIYEAVGDESKQLAGMMKADRLPLWLLRLLFKRAQRGDPYVPPCVLMIEDLGEAEIGDQLAGAGREKVAAGLSALAQIHAATWGTRAIPDTHWTKGPQYIPRIIHTIYLNSRDSFLAAAEPVFSAHSLAVFNSLQKTGLQRAKQLHETVPECLAHGDYRLDNMFFADDGSVAAVIDWQNAAPGPGVLDLGYFICSSLHADTPESVVDDLLAGYHAELVANGVDDYPLDRFLADYIDGLFVVLHRMAGLTEIVDVGDGRGVGLIETWLKRLDTRLQRISL